MIERRKIDVVRKDLGNDPERTLGIYLDRQKPWGWALWTKADLEHALEAWNDLVSPINDRLPEPHAEPLSEASLFEVDDFRVADIEEGSFAWAIYAKACRPNFQFFAQGLQLAFRGQLLANPFRQAWVGQTPHQGLPWSPGVFPLPILLSTQRANSWMNAYEYEVG
jgi:hypothetical protein